MGNDATAVTALYLIISALRRFSVAERQLRAGEFEASRVTQGRRDPTVRTLAVLGMGGIGLRLAELVHAFPMRVVYHNRRPFAGAPERCEYYGADRLDEMLGMADVLSVHVPLRKETEGLVNETMIRKLKKGAILINTARGKVVDEEAMLRALEDGHVGCSYFVLIFLLTSVFTAIWSRPGRVCSRTSCQSTLTAASECDALTSPGVNLI